MPQSHLFSGWSTHCADIGRVATIKSENLMCCEEQLHVLVMCNFNHTVKCAIQFMNKVAADIDVVLSYHKSTCTGCHNMLQQSCSCTICVDCVLNVHLSSSLLLAL
jgi:hypothetical protein